jgi:MarR family multiple antibiotic resistance transcriptional regulator
MNNSSEVGLNLSTIGMLIVAARRSIRQLIAAKVVPLDITPHHYWMLMILFKGAPMSLGELARAMWMDNPTVSRMVQQMGLRGFLTVGPDPTHGRRIRIRLTPEGLTLCDKLLKIGAEFQEGSQKGMTPEEAAVLREVLCKYIRNLDVMVANELPGMPIRPQHHHTHAEEHQQASGI